MCDASGCVASSAVYVASGREAGRICEHCIGRVAGLPVELIAQAAFADRAEV